MIYSQFHYRKLDPKTANKVLERADQINVDYDIWNMVFLLDGDETDPEIGIVDWTPFEDLIVPTKEMNDVTIKSQEQWRLVNGR